MESELPRGPVTVLAFAQARDAFGFSSMEVPCAPDETARMVLERLAPDAVLTHLRVALDHEYVAWDTPMASARELAIIPPVSGG